LAWPKLDLEEDLQLSTFNGLINVQQQSKQVQLLLGTSSFHLMLWRLIEG
jgi:hypothetical protein